MVDRETLDHLKGFMDIIEIQQSAITNLVSAVLVLSQRVDLLETNQA